MKIFVINILKRKATKIILSVYQVLAGLLGLYVGFQQPFLYIISHIFYFVFIMGLFIFSIFSGIFLLKKEPLKGIKFSIVNQALQIGQFKFLGFGFQYIAGCYLGFGFSDTPVLHIIYKSSIFQSSCFISFNTENMEISFVFNVVAILFFLILKKMKKYYLTYNPKVVEDTWNK